MNPMVMPDYIVHQNELFISDKVTPTNKENSLPRIQSIDFNLYKYKCTYSLSILEPENEKHF